MARLIVASISVLAASLGAAACAAAQETPRLRIEIPIELQNDGVLSGSRRDVPAGNELFFKIEPEATLRLLPGLSAVAHAVLEPIRPRVSDVRILGDHGLFLEELKLVYEQDGIMLSGGKLNPAFGVGFDMAPGIYGDDVPDEYELTERLGFALSVPLGGDSGAEDGPRLTASIFAADTSVLSRSLLADRGRVRRSDGGPGNTDGFSSLALALQGPRIPGLPIGLGYHLAGRYQAGGQGDPRDETGLAAALFGRVELGGGLTLDPFVEYVRLWNAEAQRQDRDYITVGGQLGLGSWIASVTYIGRFTGGAAPDRDDHQGQLTVGYDLLEDLRLEAGYRIRDFEGALSHTLGLRLTWDVAIEVP